MQTRLAEWIRDTPRGKEAERILRACVHCGFCTATCPTYLLLGDEQDGPRGRIYLMKQVLEGITPSASTREHLDRCLTCRNCETSCPSGVEYGRLLEIGREIVDEQVPRGRKERLTRALLRGGLVSTAFVPLYRLGRALRPLLPRALQRRLPPTSAARPVPGARHGRRVILPEGCVQGVMMPGVDAATARILDRVGISVERPMGAARCCGAVRAHLGDASGALAQARRNIDAWWPAIEAGAEGIVANASACGLQIKDYGRLLAGDPLYAARAERVSVLARDLVEWLGPEIGRLPRVAAAGTRVAFHPPCTLQHGQQLGGAVEAFLQRVGVELVPFAERHLCCGSAGTYSVLQPTIADALRDRKLAHLGAAGAEVILSANVGCLAHLAGGASVPVRHWIEWLDERLTEGRGPGARMIGSDGAPHTAGPAARRGGM